MEANLDPLCCSTPPTQVCLSNHSLTGTALVADDGASSEKKEIALSTAPRDPKFPSVNQAKYCFYLYNLVRHSHMAQTPMTINDRQMPPSSCVQYYKCLNENGEDNSECHDYKRRYRSVCPDGERLLCKRCIVVQPQVQVACVAL